MAATPDTLDAIDLTDLARFENGFPHEVFTHLRAEAPVWFHPPTEHTPGGEGFWVLSRYRDIQTAASDGETFSSQGGGGREGGGILIEDLPMGWAAGVLINMMDDPRHHRIRRLLTPAVSAKALALLEPELTTRARAIIDDAEAAGGEGGGCDFLVEVAAELPLQAVSALLGVPQGDRHMLIEWADATTDYAGRNLGQSDDRSRRAAADMLAYGQALLEEKRRCPADDLLSVVAHAEVEGSDGGLEPLSAGEQEMFFNLLIAAGSETTRNSIAMGIHSLSEQPDQWCSLHEDRSLIPGAVEEVLRWASSTTYNRRTLTRDLSFAGQEMRAGEKVTLWWISANRDERVFDDPFRFDVRREPNPHLTFGHGSHFCLGAALARMEIRIMLEELLDRFEAIEPTGAIQFTRSNKHLGVRHMPVRFHRRREAVP
ncbi:MAG: cytochrome P450 [Actinobacteria bacterium]|nr:cytochrome P450 [Actinomycetota bacterium]